MQSIKDNMTSNEPTRIELINRTQKVRDWFKEKGFRYYGEFFRHEYPDFENFTRLGNVMTLKTADKEITEMMEKLVEKLDNK